MTVVSVVIPTKARPVLVLRAVASVLAQSYRALELIVVVDGPDLETVERLGALDDPRLAIIVNPASLGCSAARNLGAAQAAGRWIAFLDDDDEWLPDKLAQQMALAETCRWPAILSCRSEVISPAGSAVGFVDAAQDDLHFVQALKALQRLQQHRRIDLAEQQ